MRERAAGANFGAGEDRVDDGEHNAGGSVSDDAAGGDIGAGGVLEVRAQRRESVASDSFGWYVGCTADTLFARHCSV